MELRGFTTNDQIAIQGGFGPIFSEKTSEMVLVQQLLIVPVTKKHEGPVKNKNKNKKIEDSDVKVVYKPVGTSYQSLVQKFVILATKCTLAASAMTQASSAEFQMKSSSAAFLWTRLDGFEMFFPHFVLLAV